MRLPASPRNSPQARPRAKAAPAGATARSRRPPRRRTRRELRNRNRTPFRLRTPAGLGPGSPPARGRTRLLLGAPPPESLLLPPRSAHARRPRPPTLALLAAAVASLLSQACRASDAPSPPSIFGARRFGGGVATHSLAAADFYGHRPTVLTGGRPSSSSASGSLARHQVHPSSPALLTRTGPPARRGLVKGPPAVARTSCTSAQDCPPPASCSPPGTFAVC